MSIMALSGDVTVQSPGLIQQPSVKSHVDTEAVLDSIEIGASMTSHSRLNVSNPVCQHAIADFADDMNFTNETIHVAFHLT